MDDLHAWVPARTRHSAQPIRLYVQHSSICVTCLMFLLSLTGVCYDCWWCASNCVLAGVCVICLMFLLYADWCVLTTAVVHYRLWSDTWSNCSACTCTQTVPPRSGILSTAVRTREHHAATTLTQRAVHALNVLHKYGRVLTFEFTTCIALLTRACTTALIAWSRVCSQHVPHNRP